MNEEELISIKNRLDKILNSGKEPVYCEELITTGELQRLLEEIERLHSIIKELRIKFYETFRINQNGSYTITETDYKDIEEILDKVGGDSNDK